MSIEFPDYCVNENIWWGHMAPTHRHCSWVALCWFLRTINHSNTSHNLFTTYFHFPNPASLIEHLQQPISDNTITTIYRQNNVLNCIACNRLYKISIYSHRFSIIKHQENKSSLVNKIIRPWQIFHCANYSVVLDRLNSTHSA